MRFSGYSNFGMVDKGPATHPPSYPPSYPIEGGGGIDDPDIGYYANIDALPRIVLGPHAKTDIRSVQLSVDDLKKISLGTWRMSIAGSLRYEDIFDETKVHITKFCYSIRSLQLPNGDLRPTYDFCPYWNCTDDDCKADRTEYRAAVTKVFQRFDKQVPADFYKPIPPE